MQRGRDGRGVIVTRVVRHDGVTVQQRQLDRRVTQPAGPPRSSSYGTKVRPFSAPATGAEGLNWGALAACESGATRGRSTRPATTGSTSSRCRPGPRSVARATRSMPRPTSRPTGPRCSTSGPAPGSGRSAARCSSAEGTLGGVTTTAPTRSCSAPEPSGELAERLDVRPTKRWGQNFVVDANTVRRIVRACRRRARTTSSSRSAPASARSPSGCSSPVPRVVAVEIDPILAARPAGHRRRPHAARVADRLTVVAAGRTAADRAARDARRPSSPTCPTTWRCRCCSTCSAQFPSLDHGLVMVQWEVAERLAAPPGSRTYGVPSVKAAWYAEVTQQGRVPRSVFWPVPNVDSGLVGFRRRPAPRTDRHPARRSSPASTPPSPSAARACVRPWPRWAGGVEAAERRCGPRASTPRCAVSGSTSPTSRRSLRIAATAGARDRLLTD